MDSPANQNIKADDDAKDIGWFSLNDLPPLAFDHTVIIGDVVNEYIRD